MNIFSEYINKNSSVTGNLSNLMPLIGLQFKTPVDVNETNNSYTGFKSADYTDNYRLIGMKNLFNNGKFTQVLTLIAPSSIRETSKPPTSAGINPTASNNKSTVPRKIDPTDPANIAGVGQGTASGEVKEVPNPTGGEINDEFHFRQRHPVTGKPQFHDGVDMTGKLGTPVKTVDNGTVIFSGFVQNYGNRVEILHEDGTITTYSHLSNFNVKSGDTISQGSVLGAVGSTGTSSGPHLHFETIVPNNSPLASSENAHSAKGKVIGLPNDSYGANYNFVNPRFKYKFN